MTFPSVTAVRVQATRIDAVGHVVANLVLGLRGASRAHAGRGARWCWAARSRPATATGSMMRWCSRCSAPRRGRLLGAYGLEYLLLGGATAVFGVAAGSVAAWLVVTRVMNLTFGWLPGPASRRHLAPSRRPCSWG